MILKDKVALVYGTGDIGTAVAEGFAAAGAMVFLAGRTLEKAEAVVNRIRANGGTAHAAEVDALDEMAVNAFVELVKTQAGRIDISFNVIGYEDIQKPLQEITLDEFLQPIDHAMRTQFITMRAATPQMMEQKSGVILTFGGGGPQTAPGLGGFKVALDAIEGLRRQWATEFGEYGIRVVTIKTGGIVETISEEEPGRDEIVKTITDLTLLKRAATLEDVKQVSVFLASDHARSITATEINISAGGIVE